MHRLYNLILCCAAYMYSFTYTRSDKALDGAKVLIFHTGKLGDTICITPMIQALVQSRHKFKCVVAGSSINKEVLEHHPYVHDYIVVRQGIIEQIKFLRKEHPQIICITTPNLKSLIAALFSRASFIVAPEVVGGYSPYMTLGYRFLLTRVTKVPFVMNEYTPQQYLNLLKPLGIESVDTQKHIYYSKQAEDTAHRLIQNKSGGKTIGLALGAGNDIKQWPIKNFVELTRELLKQNTTDIVYIFGGAKEKDIIQDFRNHFSTKELERIISVSDVSIDELKACISRLDLFVGVDTGPIYIAEAFNIPLVDIIGPVSEKEQPPQGPNARLVYLRDRKKPEIHIMNSRVYNVAEARRQIEEITVEMVLKAIDELLPKIL